MAGVVCRLVRIHSTFAVAGLLILPRVASGLDLLVYNNADVGAGSLRQAVNFNNTNGGGSTIIFSNSAMGTITLTNGELVITTNVTIVGPGADVLTISGNNASRIFRITNAVATISGLSIVKGNV